MSVISLGNQEPESIIASRERSPNIVEYLVRWHDYPVRYDSWVSAANFDYPTLVAAYRRQGRVSPPALLARIGPTAPADAEIVVPRGVHVNRFHVFGMRTSGSNLATIVLRLFSNRAYGDELELQDILRTHHQSQQLPGYSPDEFPMVQHRIELVFFDLERLANGNPQLGSHAIVDPRAHRSFQLFRVVLFLISQGIYFIQYADDVVMLHFVSAPA